MQLCVVATVDGLGHTFDALGSAVPANAITSNPNSYWQQCPLILLGSGRGCHNGLFTIWVLATPNFQPSAQLQQCSDAADCHIYSSSGPPFSGHS